MSKTIYIETLGCARNQVDSEMIMGQFKEAGWVLTDNPDQAATIADDVMTTLDQFIESQAIELIELE